MTESEQLVRIHAQLALADPGNPVTIDVTTDLESAFSMGWVEKQDLLTELKDAFEIPPNDDAQGDAADLAMTGVPWVVRDLARYLERRAANG
jgi:hypothetical protein